jgi:hypothetical protein
MIAFGLVANEALLRLLLVPQDFWRDKNALQLRSQE